MRKTSFIFLISFVLSSFCLAQKVTTIAVPAKSNIEIADRATAIVLKSETYLGTEVTVILNGSKVLIPYDPDAPDFTYFRSLESPLIRTDINIELPQAVQLYLIDSGQPPKVQASGFRYDADECVFAFEAIQQSEWRKDLPAPNYNRSFTNVKHVVVHHSAGSNTATNYTQVVRDIYLYHTEVNGWSDIGYNYLIAQNGAIYAGRDPGGAGSQDNVLGAHFCGSNSTTMGICLLGNYETATPTAGAWNSLIQVTTFKIDKENLDPLGKYNHPFGNLGSIIGHRDGGINGNDKCNTLCPGEHVYEKLDELRQAVNDNIETCTPPSILDFTLQKTKASVGEEVLVENRSTGYSHYQWLFEGGEPDTAYWVGNGAVSYTTPGLYDITLIGFRDNTSDTLFSDNAIAIEGKPIVYPNPIIGREISIAANEIPSEIYLFGMFGERHSLIHKTENRFYLPHLKAGVYFIRFRIQESWYVQKLILY